MLDYTTLNYRPITFIVKEKGGKDYGFAWKCDFSSWNFKAENERRIVESVWVVSIYEDNHPVHYDDEQDVWNVFYMMM